MAKADEDGDGDMPGPDGAKPVIIKKYANRRLYNTETSTYITLDHLGAMVREGRDDREIVAEFYRLALGRGPRDEELRRSSGG